MRLPPTPNRTFWLRPGRASGAPVASMSLVSIVRQHPNRGFRTWRGRAVCGSVAAVILGSLALVSTPAGAQPRPRPATAWTQQQPADNPAARAGTVMATDPATNTVVLFGGYVGAQSVNDTWTWDGHHWTQLHPRVSPPGRGNAEMAFDPATKTVVLFGGSSFDPTNGFVALDDTWTWDGHNWTAHHPAVSPSTPLDGSMAFDPSTHRVLLLLATGDPNSPNPFAETWTWDGTNWTQRHPHHEPSDRGSTAMASDPANNTVVLFGGTDFTGAVPPPFSLDDTWTWNGIDWTQQAPAHHPPARFGHSMAFGRTSGLDNHCSEWGSHRGDSVVLFGGDAGGASFNDVSKLLNDTWTWDGTDWSQQNPVSQPPPRRYAGMAAALHTHTVVLFGGVDSSHATLGDTWAYAPSSHTDNQRR
jgi:hypothetical protein